MEFWLQVAVGAQGKATAFMSQLGSEKKEKKNGMDSTMCFSSLPP